MIPLKLRTKKVVIEVADNHGIGIEARALRKKSGCRLGWTAARMGISISYLCDLEHGRKSWNRKLIESFIGAIK